MELIEKLEPTDFKNYLKQYDNTICGRHPISVFLNVFYFITFILSIIKYGYLFLIFNFKDGKKSEW